jgi:hypothetical protein
MGTWALGGGTWGSGRLLALAVIQNVVLLVTEFTLLKNAVVKFL